MKILPDLDWFGAKRQAVTVNRDDVENIPRKSKEGSQYAQGYFHSGQWRTGFGRSCF